MEILNQTSTELTIRFRPWYMWVTGGLSILIGMPIIVNAFMLGKTNTFTCQRVEQNQGSCQIVTKFLLLSEVKTIPLQSLQGARYDDKLTDGKGDRQQRLILLTRQGEIAFPSIRTYHSNRQAVELKAIATDINAFLKTSGQLSFTVTQGNSRDSWIISAFLIVQLVFLAFCCEVVTCNFNKNIGIFIKKRKWLFFIKKLEKPLLEIVEVLVEERINKGKKYRITLVLASGKRIPLTAYYTNYGVGPKKTQEAADGIAKFLNLKPGDRQ